MNATNDDLAEASEGSPLRVSHMFDRIAALAATGDTEAIAIVEAINGHT